MARNGFQPFGGADTEDHPLNDLVWEHLDAKAVQSGVSSRIMPILSERPPTLAELLHEEHPLDPPY